MNDKVVIWERIRVKLKKNRSRDEVFVSGVIKIKNNNNKGVNGKVIIWGELGSN